VDAPPGGASINDLETGLAGCRVFRLGPDQITLDNVQRLAAPVLMPLEPFGYGLSVN